MLSSTTAAEAAQSLRSTDVAVSSDTQFETHTQPPSFNPGLAESVATACALVACVVFRLPHDIVGATGVQAWGLALVVIVSLVSGARALARAPFTLYRSLRGNTDLAVGLRRWAGGELKLIVLTIVVGTLFSLPLYVLLRATAAWWLLAWLMFAVITVVGQLGVPMALRVRAEPLNTVQAALGDRVQRLTAQAGLDVGPAVVMTARRGSRRCNAYVAGLGGTKQVVLERGLVAWPPRLVDQVVAHELGHWRLGHAARRLPLVIACQLVTLAAVAGVLSWSPLLHSAGLGHVGDPRSYPLLLVVGALLVLPARCLLAWCDCAQERSADAFALTLLGRPADFAEMLDRAATQSGAPRHLPWWKRLTASHPSIDERTAACRPDPSTTPHRIGAQPCL